MSPIEGECPADSMHSRIHGAKPSMSVVIPVLNDAFRLRKCLVALREQIVAAHEVIVVENATEFSLHSLRAEFPHVVFLNEPIPGSYRARNRGIAHATGDVVAFTDADCLPARDWLAGAGRYLAARPECAYLGGAVLVEPRQSVRLRACELYDLHYLRQSEHLSKSHFAATANLFVRSEVFKQIGAFDEALMSGGDFEFGQRVHAAGIGQAYAAGVLVRHPTRTALRELILRARRIAGGEREILRRHGVSQARRFLNWLGKLSPRSICKAIAPYRGVGVVTLMKVSMLVIILRVVTFFEIVRLNLGMRPERR
jgi:glycosyltransferase involved in cell wall biosynthesis